MKNHEIDPIHQNQAISFSFSYLGILYLGESIRQVTLIKYWLSGSYSRDISMV
jgi:hypothetical protein